jgi:DNA-directed DNA polymerase III PolC
MTAFSHSNYSLRYGTLSIESLVTTAHEAGMESLVLTDINNTTGIPDFTEACEKVGIKPIAGAEIRNGNDHLFTLVARNNAGFKEINEFITQHNYSSEPYPDRAPLLKQCYVIYPLLRFPAGKLHDNEFAGIAIRDINKLRASAKSNHIIENGVILQPVTFMNDEGYELHRHLRAIDNNILLSQLEPEMLAHASESFIRESELIKCYEALPQVVRNTKALLDDCTFSFDFKTIKNKKTFTGSNYDDRLLLEKLAHDGLIYRYGKNNKEAIRRIKHELEVIDNLGFSSYFLITWDIIRYSMSRGFYHVGRGSGANSIVAYCLRITDVDPIELDLYFERFLNPKRKSPPDFDIDYSWKERDDVTEYIFKRYGREHTALLGAMSTFKGKSIIREMGKVYGLPKAEIDALVESRKTTMELDSITKPLFHYGKMLSEFPNLRTIHAGGILISEEPITCYTALDLPPKGYPTTQWDMYVAEAIGFEKLDILSQRGIGHIKDASDLVLRNRRIKVDVHDVPMFKRDEMVKEQLKSGDTIGCFYIESPAMRGLLKKLHCSEYVSLVAASSIIRPGVAKSGMMKEYIQRFHNPGGFSYLHPVMKEQLEETYGVMVYQEDVIKVCHHFAGLDLADADVLRRAMSGKSRSKKEMQLIVDKFFENCKAKGYADDLTKEVWRQIESFAGYSFSKAHSASYAVESYQSLYLKTYFPHEFHVAVINNFGGFYSTWVYVNEARKWGAAIHLPCVNKSEFNTTIYGTDVYLGFNLIQNFETSFAQSIPMERLDNGDFVNLEDFVNRTRITIEQLILLIRLDAFRFTGTDKKQLLWDAHMILGKSTPPASMQQLFTTPSKHFELPVLVHQTVEDAFDEMELLGFPVTLSGFDLLKTTFRGEIKAKELVHHIGKKVRMVGNLVTIKYVTTVRHDMMNFGTFLDDEGNFFDTVHFADSLNRYPFKGRGVYLILGKVVEEFGFPSLEVEKLARLETVSDPRY